MANMMRTNLEATAAPKRYCIGGGILNGGTVKALKMRSTFNALDRLYLERSKYRNVTWHIQGAGEHGLFQLLSMRVEKKKVVVNKVTGVQDIVHLVDRDLSYGWHENVDRNGNKVKVYILPVESIAYTIRQEIDTTEGRYLFAIYCRKVGVFDGTPAWICSGSIYSEAFEKDAERLRDQIDMICNAEELEPLY